MNSSPLSGIKILDLSRLLPGPLATQMLGDMGAEVIKIEDLNSPDYIRFFPPFSGEDSALYLSLNRNKKALALNLRTPEGKEIFFAMLQTADVVVEQFRPGVLDKMSMGYADAKKINPKIIYVSVTGYGQTGPYAQKAGHDLNYIAMSGLLANIGTKEKPVIPGIQIADVSGSYAAVNGCLAALLQREKTGEGKHVDISMTDSAMPFATLIHAQAWAENKNVERQNFQLSGALASYNVYETSDAKFVALGALEPKFWKTFCLAVQQPQWENRLFGTSEEITQLKNEVAALFKSKTRKDWEAFSQQHDVCLSPVLENSELAANENLLQRNMILKNGTLNTIGSVIKFSDTTPQHPQPAPKLGQHTNEILRELKLSDEKNAELKKNGIVF
ncbi:MAG: Acetyl-CoA:oxalate CoA-transferase [Bacteroidia bacterium]|nr:Acetyl-CoA:oxalate CoA-transferase [Bacteroidia bacterium]